jgi:penicillin G amidase
LNPFRFVFRLLLGRRLPLTRGALTVPGLQGPVRIRRDRWGIPHVDADDPLDGYFAVGFCHGQDRSFQLEVILRAGRGTLAEMVGPAVLPLDRLSRRIGFHHSAREQWPALDPDIRAMLEAYAAGINAGRAAGSPRPAHEFALLKASPTPWAPLDSVAVVKILSFTLCSNWDVELARLRLLRSDGPEALAALDPAYPPWQPVTSPPGAPAGAALDRLGEDLAELQKVAGLGGGSNNWVVSGARTATGRPLLANDPHLDARVPAHWYLMRVRTPGFAVAGATFLGGPSFPVGHNGHAAWGVTAGLIDNTDLFLEQVGADGASVRQGDGFVPCPVREEVIQVRGAGPVTERVLVTPRGPVISPALPGVSEALSLRATWLDPLPIGGLLRVHHARSFAEFRRLLADWPVASQNVVYADTSGTIGWQMAGRAPRRRKGNGTVPLPGWDPEVGWERDPVPYEEVPHGVDPPEGFLATANTRPVPEGEGPYLGADFVDGYRLAAITRALSARRDWDVGSTQALQLDQRTLAWEEMRAAVLSAPGQDDDARQGLELLRGWDGRLLADSPGACVYEVFVAEMAGRVARAKAPKGYEVALGLGQSALTPSNFFTFRRVGHLVNLLRTQPAGWFARGWPAEVADALGAVVRRLRAGHGANPGGWAWGRLRRLTMHHPLGRTPGALGRVFARVFNLGPVPWGGDADTISQAAAPPLAPLADTDNIASLRAVFDVGAWHNSRFCLPGGQSGNPLSPHYADQFPLWRRGEGVPIAFTEEEVAAAAVEALELRPPGERGA